MKKRIGICCLFVLLVFLSGCSNSNSSQGDAVETANKTQSNIAKQKEVLITKGETVEVEDFCEFTVASVKFAKKITPPNIAGFHTYYETKELDTTYLDVVINIKSLLETGKNAEEFASVKVIYNDKYDYTAFSVMEDSGGSEFAIVGTIEPLTNGTVHNLAEVPDEVAESDKPVHAIITVHNQDYRFDIR